MKRLVALMLALVMSLALVACGSKPAETPSDNSDATENTDGIKIGIITLNMEAQYWLDVVAGLRSVIESNGGTVVHYSSENDVQKAVQQIRPRTTPTSFSRRSRPTTMTSASTWVTSWRSTSRKRARL